MKPGLNIRTLYLLPEFAKWINTYSGWEIQGAIRKEKQWIRDPPTHTHTLETIPRGTHAFFKVNEMKRGSEALLHLQDRSAQSRF